MEAKKDKVVVFTRNNARIYTNVDKASFENDKNVLINPSFDSVKGIPPHFWKMYEGRIVPMNDVEREERLKDIDKNGIDNGEGYTSVQSNQVIIRPVYVDIPKEVVVEKVVEVEKIVEKIVEVPVDRIVEKEVIKEVPVVTERVVFVDKPVVTEKVIEVMVPKYIDKEVVHPYEIEKQVVVVQEKLITSKLAWVLLGLETIGVIIWHSMM